MIDVVFAAVAALATQSPPTLPNFDKAWDGYQSCVTAIVVKEHDGGKSPEAAVAAGFEGCKSLEQITMLSMQKNGLPQERAMSRMAVVKASFRKALLAVLDARVRKKSK